jgi:SAM-dependent methyltransferase
MPTLPPAPGPFSQRESHEVREVAESFGTDAGRYDRARPSYPDALVNRIVAASPGRDILDVGCGTGIVARQLQAAGCQVLGVDVDERMADLARQRGLEVEVAKFEDWDSAGRTFDTITAGQAWHWVDPVAGAAKAQQVLRPGGQLALFWNAFEIPPEIQETFGAVYRRVMPDVPMFQRQASAVDAYATMCDKASAGMRETGAFGEPEQWRFGWERPYTKAEWLDLVPTTGFHTKLEPATLQELLTGLGAAIDEVGGTFTMHYTTVTITATRTTTPTPA